MGGLKKSKIEYNSCLHVKYQFLRTKCVEMRSKPVFEQDFFNILSVFSNKSQILTNLKPLAKSTQKIVFQI